MRNRSGAYSGSATIKFSIIRKTSDDEEREIELEVHGNSYFSPGKYYGPWEDSYPDEGDTEIVEVTLDGKLWDGELTDKEERSAEELIDEAVREQEPEPDFEIDYDD